ncbi:transcription factor Adf-1-like isoform X2 [Ischnura elegans]|uniref:transcription factor Adf-1-like isoform X2 n=1 Tax=Ischnura elegans TaxID=197161 RepID=UPI001ED87A70|nr:transcription factor Adf-1-like isoform X2 [Ischnura elegans]
MAKQDRNSYIIQSVRNYFWLYDKRSADFKDVTKRQETWESIGKAVGLSPEDAQTRWKSLRERYVRERKKREAGQESDGLPEWVHYKEMTFLDEHLHTRRRIGSRNTAIAGPTNSCQQGGDQSYKGVKEDSDMDTFLSDDGSSNCQVSASPVSIPVSAFLQIADQAGNPSPPLIPNAKPYPSNSYSSYNSPHGSAVPKPNNKRARESSSPTMEIVAQPRKTEDSAYVEYVGQKIKTILKSKRSMREKNKFKRDLVHYLDEVMEEMENE